MANIVVVSTANSLKVDFGIFNTLSGWEKGTWSKDSIESVRLEVSSLFVSIIIKTGEVWKLTYNSSSYFQVDSIDGVAPISNSDLYDKLIVLIA